MASDDVPVDGRRARRERSRAALIDATSSPEAFEVLSAAHGRTRRQIERTWRRALVALVAGWSDTTNDPAQER